jgi:hypothetical protein
LTVPITRLIFGIATNPLLATWIASIGAVVWFLARRTIAQRAAAADRRRAQRAFPLALVAVAIGLAVASGMVIAFGGPGRWRAGWVLAVVAAAIGVARVVGPFQRTATQDHPTAAQGQGPQRVGVMGLGTILALVTSIGLAVLSVFIRNSDADDVFYINRAQWVADHGTIAVRDTIFTDQACHDSRFRAYRWHRSENPAGCHRARSALPAAAWLSWAHHRSAHFSRCGRSGG